MVGFSEPVELSGAESSGNYSISHGIEVSTASLDPSGESVTLTTSNLSSGITYVLTVNNVQDLAGNTIVTDSQVPFVYAEPSEGLIGYWPLDEGAGTTTVDASGNGHLGTLVNGPQWVDEVGLHFDGDNDYVDVGVLDGSGDELTLAAWFYSEDLASCVSRDCRIVSKATGTAENDHYFMLSTIQSGNETRLRFRLKTDGSTETLIASSGNLPEDTWVHAAAVYDGSNMQLFLNGAAVGTTSRTGGLTTNDSIPVWIGGNPPGGSDRPWEGFLDEIRIYDRALSQSEIQALPGPGVQLLFRDGFESGDETAWSAALP